MKKGGREDLGARVLIARRVGKCGDVVFIGVWEVRVFATGKIEAVDSYYGAWFICILVPRRFEYFMVKL